MIDKAFCRADFCLAAALMGMKTDMLCYVNKREWESLINGLQQIGIGSQFIGYQLFIVALNF